jgi:PAS domain S-box-containing protein|tara:strand:+ start:163 stop:2262 length:2100 start_codon:yes stop_codon:yes gene_type:complete
MLDFYIDALRNREDFLLKQLFKYASEADYTRHTSSKEQEWRMTVQQPVNALIEYLLHHDDPDPIHVDENFEENPTAAFGILEAKRHRQRGVRFDMFLGLAKYVRQSFVDLIHDVSPSLDGERQALAVTHRFFDKFELGFTTEWLRCEETTLIRELQDSNRELTNSKKSYQTIFQSIADPSFVVDTELRLVDGNIALEKYFNVVVEGIKGKPCGEVIACGSCNTCPLQTAMLQQRPISGIESTIAVRGVERHVSMSVSSIQDSSRNQAGGVVVLQDVTNRKRIEEGLARHREELEHQVLQRSKHLQREMEERIQVEQAKDKLEKQLLQAQKMEAMGTLSVGIAHDFNNILAGILGFSELAQRQVHDGSPACDSIDEIVTAASRAADLVRQILTFSRKDEPNKVTVEVQPLMREVLSFLASVVPSNVDIQSRIQTDDDRIIADPTQIHQVLVNLCTNASAAMEDCGGTLLLVIDAIEIESNPVYIQYGLRCGSYLKLNVRDTGCGIKPEVLDRIFEPFFTTNDVGKGTGMGLAVVHTIIQQHGGFITVDSSPGEWTNFTILLPRSQHDTVVVEHDGRADRSRGTEQVLFVDDEEAITRANKELLELSGYRVVTTNSSKEALEIFNSQPDDFDIIVTDQAMPDIAGDELCREIRGIRPDIPVVLCTGFSERIDDESAIDRYLVKPFSIATLGDTIRNVLDEG